MKRFYDSGHAEMRATPRASSPFDDLPLPGGGKVADLGNADLVNVLAPRGVPVKHANGRAANLEMYSDFLDGIRKSAADEAVAKWIAEAA